MFTHLHVHSYFSFLEGLASPRQLAQTASNLGMQALALTDHLFLTGAIEFYDACIAEGIKPILGLEIDVEPPSDLSASSTDAGALVLLAMDLSGWRSLCRLSSAVLTDPDNPRSRVPFARLGQDTDGLLCLTGGSKSLAARLIRSGDKESARSWLEHLHQAFPHRLYVELQRHSREDTNWILELSSLANLLHLPDVATHSVFYLKPEQAELQRVISAIRSNTPFDSLPRYAAAPTGAYFLSPEEMASRFVELPAAVEMTAEIADRCHLDLPLGVPHFPEIVSSAGSSPSQMLRSKAEKGAIRLYGGITREVRSRLDHEIDVIESAGYTSLFLIVEEILTYAREHGVPVSSRGSAASSLVAHCLGITSPDPLRLDLYFERFLNPDRATPPDIDTDLCSRRRDGVIDFVYRRFGEERVAMVCTINRFRRRSALREVAKAYGLPPKVVNDLTASLPHRWYGPPDFDTSKDQPFASLSARFTSPTHQAIFRDAAELLGNPHHLSIHPGGIVISPGALTDLVPTQIATKGVVITQCDLESIERLGLIKIDLLGIRGLTVLGDVAETVHSINPQAHHDALGVLEAIPEDDRDTAELVRTGKTIGCFQIESPGMRATLKEIQADSEDDIMAALALYRPGPLTGGQKADFVRRFKGLEMASYLHPALIPLLEDTYGVILYQEQVLRIAHRLAGLSLADADLLRRAMSHFDPGKQMQTLKEKFIAGAKQISSVPEDVSERIWELMAAFAGYGFPKAHAASYAQVAWRSAWCKMHFPADFMAAVLANWGGYYRQSNYLTEARRMGLSLRPPHINHARREFSVKHLDGKPVLFMGLDQVRDLTRQTQTRILMNRPFQSFEDFLARGNPRPVEAENLVRCGAMEGLGSIPTLIRRLERGGWQGGQLSLFASPEVDAGEFSLAEKVAAQEAVLGVSVDVHRLELFARQIAASGALTTVDAAARIGQRVQVAGTRQFWRRGVTSRGDYIYFMSLEDLEGMLDVIIAGDVYRRSREALRSDGPYVLEGTVELNPDKSEPFIRAERIWKIQAE